MSRWRWAGGAAAVFFAVLVLRFWHPVYGFTRFLQLDAANDSTNLHEFHEQPIYVYKNTGGYDGQYYAQIAYRPLLNDPALRTAIDNLNYRARRILPAALAWTIALGRAAEIARVYAMLNLGAWFILAAMAWRLLKVGDAKSFAAWAGIMFSTGALTSVRFALTDLIAATLTVAAMMGVEAAAVEAAPPPLSPSKGGAAPQLSSIPLRPTWGSFKAAGAPLPRPSFLLFPLAALSRETAVLALPGLWTKPWLSRRNFLLSFGAALPLALWLAYIHWRLGPGDAGWSNFTWPLHGFAGKWIASVRALGGPVDFALTFTTLLAVAGLTVQAAYCFVRPRPDEPWWRVGIVYTLLLAFLGQPVWEDFPGAVFRAVLPLTIAFNVLAVRRRAAWAVVIAGNLTVAAGVFALWIVPIDPLEMAAVRSHERSAVVSEGTGWYGTERTGRHQWTWARGAATLVVETWPHERGTLRCELKLRSLVPQDLTVRQGSRVCWSGSVPDTKVSAAWDVAVVDGRAVVDLQPSLPPAHDGSGTDARALAFALYDLKVSFADARSGSP